MNIRLFVDQIVIEIVYMQQESAYLVQTFSTVLQHN